MKQIFILILAALCVLAGCATPLTTAVEKRDIQEIKALLDSGANINEPGGDPAFTPLIFAIRYKYFDVAKLLIERGADVNFSSPLTYAAEAGDINMVNLLIEKGADVNLNQGMGPPLTEAARHGKFAIIERLLEKGADLEYTLAWCEQTSSNYMGLLRDYYAPCVTTLRSVKAKRETSVQQAAKSRDLTNKDVKLQLGQPASDVDTPPSRRVKTNANAYAIVIGIEQYRQKLPRADYATHDARIVTDYLTKVLGYPEENVVTLLNEHASNVDLAKYFEKWLPNNVETGSTVFVYFSGHGAPDLKSGGAYLVPYDGDPSFIAETGYSLKRMYDALGKLPAKEIVVALDSCFSGAGGRSVLAKGARPLVMNLGNIPVTTRNMTIMTAASGDQISSTYEEKGHGLFTYFMLKGIKDEDVLKKDGSIAIHSLFSYLKPQVERMARRQYNNEQSPQLISSDNQ